MNAALRDSGIAMVPAIEARTATGIVAQRVAFSVTVSETVTLEEAYVLALDPERLPDDKEGRATTLRTYCNWVTQALLDEHDADTLDGPQSVTYRLHPAFKELVPPAALNAVTDEWNDTHEVPMTMAYDDPEATEEPIAMKPGDRRYDCEREKDVVVTATHENVSAAEWGIFETRRTVAEHNQRPHTSTDYPDDDRVIDAVYVDSLNPDIGSDGLSPVETVVRQAAVGTLDERKVQIYAFPESRLPEVPEES